MEAQKIQWALAVGLSSIGSESYKLGTDGWGQGDGVEETQKKPFSGGTGMKGPKTQDYWGWILS